MCACVCKKPSRGAVRSTREAQPHKNKTYGMTMKLKFSWCVFCVCRSGCVGNVCERARDRGRARATERLPQQTGNDTQARHHPSSHTHAQHTTHLQQDRLLAVKFTLVGDVAGVVGELNGIAALVGALDQKLLMIQWGRSCFCVFFLRARPTTKTTTTNNRKHKKQKPCFGRRGRGR